MMIPTIHSNGTSKRELMDQLCNASNALDDAYRVMKLAGPNGRDYYPQGDDALMLATAEYMSRLSRVDSVKEEIDELTRKIGEQP